MPYKIDPRHDALIVVDVQYDFLPGGSLPVSDGLEVIPIINRLIPHFQHVFFTRDWHPADHLSFCEFPKYVDKSWPPHAVMDTPGAQLHDDLHLPENPRVINKGGDPQKEAYSAFQGTDLEAQLRKLGVQRLFISGLATDYCVKYTTSDALSHKFKVIIIEDAIRGVDNPPGSAAAAVTEMYSKGALIVNSEDLLMEASAVK
jgi:nicotinamidase/pyrazinamidase